MEYPYTKINRDQVHQFYNILLSFGYKCNFKVTELLLCFPGTSLFCVVINAGDQFGQFILFPEEIMDPNIKRIFIEDIYKFLKEVAKYKNITEY